MMEFSYLRMYQVAEEAIRYKSKVWFFDEGAARKAALAAMEVYQAGGSKEATLTALANSLNANSRVWHSDDPCDIWAV